MNKYLFLLGFFVFSFSFLSGCKMSDFYSAPVTNADSAPVADADSTLVADTDSAPLTAAGPGGLVIYSGVVYDNNGDDEPITCKSVPGLYSLQQSRRNGEDIFVKDCTRQFVTKFIFFKEKELFFKELSGKHKYMAAFVSYVGTDEWEYVYMEVNAGVRLHECDDAPEGWRKECQENVNPVRCLRKKSAKTH